MKKPKSPPDPGSVDDPDMKAPELPPVASPTDERIVDVMTDVMGGGGDARFRSKCILARFAELGWKVTQSGFEKFNHDNDGKPGESSKTEEI